MNDKIIFTPKDPEDIIRRLLCEKDDRKVYLLGCYVSKCKSQFFPLLLKNNVDREKILSKIFNSVLNRNPHDAIPIFEIIACIGAEAGFGLLKKTFDRDKYGSGFERYALESLALCPLKNAEEELIRRLKYDDCNSLRITAIKALCEKNIPGLKKILKDCMMTEFDLDVAVYSAKRLFMLGEEGWLVKKLNHIDKMVSCAAAVILYHFNNPAAVSIINSLINSKAAKNVLLNLEMSKSVKDFRQSSILYVVPKGTKIEILAQNEKGRFVYAAHENTNEDTIYTGEEYIGSNRRYHIFKDIEGGDAACRYRVPSEVVMRKVKVNF